MYIASQQQMNELDRYTMEELGLPGIVLMENAGFAVVQEMMNDVEGARPTVLVLAGIGNNGGDGFVIARRLVDAGFPVRVMLAGDVEKLKGDAKVHYEAYTKRQHEVTQYNAEILSKWLVDSDIIVDCLLGTGASGKVRSPIKEIIEAVNAAQKKVYAVDIPSGLNANTGGVVNEVAMKAFKTITFVMPKLGFFMQSGPQYIGEWKVADISVPSRAVEELSMQLPVLLDETLVRNALPERPLHGHKGTFGHCLIVGGCINYVGAPQYTAKAAFKSGVGLVTLAVPNEIYPIVASQCPECLLLPLHSQEGSFSGEALADIDFSSFKVVAFGPGIGRRVDGKQLLHTIFSKCEKQTIVIDADGLYFYKQLLDEGIVYHNGSIIVTPHPGEMATLTELSVKEVEANRLTIALNFAKQHHVFVLLKGHRPIIAAPTGDCWINPHGNDALGKGGSGDVLTGLITSYVTQGASAIKAMQAASYIHARAAELLGEQQSHASVTPIDIINAFSYLPFTSSV